MYLQFFFVKVSTTMEPSLQTENSANRTAGQNILSSMLPSVGSSWSRTDEHSTFFTEGNINFFIAYHSPEQNSAKTTNLPLV